MHVYIPSTHRATSQNVKAGPLHCMGTDRLSSTAYVVPLGQGGTYRQALHVCGYDSVVVYETPEEVHGIAKTRHWIGTTAEKRGEAKFMMCDDDVRFFVRKTTDAYNLRPLSSTAETDEMFAVVEQMLDNYGHVAVSAREGNNRLPIGGRSSLQENTRTLRCLAYRTADFMAVEHGRVQVMEDFDVNLQLLGKGVRNANLAYWAQDQKMTSAPGGCSTYRSHETQDAAARKLADLHPGCVRLRQKENKSGGSFGSRTEVTISWAKKFKEAQACE